ncbi:hypothetical protein DL767_000479 [Monosporascus sp. MG133]|nr:hypothetical protein DL767_000479 [Monosporascus sp. MG133]
MPRNSLRKFKERLKNAFGGGVAAPGSSLTQPTGVLTPTAASRTCRSHTSEGVPPPERDEHVMEASSSYATTPHAPPDPSVAEAARATTEGAKEAVPSATASTIEVQATKARGAGKRACSAPSTSCAVSAYRYSPLPEGCIRLLRLIPHRDEHAPVQCQLFDYPLLDSGKGTHPYEALSYVWGSSEKPQYVSTNKGYLRVTTNLHIALKCLRHYALDRIIWINAICINQNDTEERNRQVRSMAKIYAKASCVVVWLEEVTGDTGQEHGKATPDSDRALEALCRAANSQPTTPSESDTGKQAILALL